MIFLSGLPPHSFGLGELFNYHFARYPYLLAYLPGQNELSEVILLRYDISSQINLAPCLHSLPGTPLRQLDLD